MGFFPLPTITAVRVAKGCIVLLPIVLAGWIVNQHYFFTAHLSYTYKPSRESSRIVPWEAVNLVRTADPKLPWRLTSDEYPFSVSIPRMIQSIRVQIRMNVGSQPVVYFSWPGNLDFVVPRKLMHSTFLEELAWPRIHLNGLTLWQRDQPVSAKNKNADRVRRYHSFQELKANLPDVGRIAAVGIDPYAFVSIPNYRPANRTLSFGHTLRGSHDFYVYAADEDLHLRFDKIDLNRKAGRSSLNASVIRVDQIVEGQGKWIKTVKVGDDGMTDGLGRWGRVQPVDLRLPDVTPGLYLIHVATSDDVLLTNFVSDQHSISSKHLWLAEGWAYGPDSSFTPVILRSNGRTLTFAPNHEPGKQRVTVNKKNYKLNDVRQAVTVTDFDGPAVIEFPHGDVIVTSDGFISFAGAEVVPDQEMVPIDMVNPPNLDDFDYVVADYVPQPDKRIIEVDQILQLRNLQLSGLSGKNLQFLITAPGLKQYDRALGLEYIKIVLGRGPFPWNKIWTALGQRMSFL